MRYDVYIYDNYQGLGFTTMVYVSEHFSLRAMVAFYERSILGVVIEGIASAIPKLMRE